MSLNHVILGLLSREPLSGYEIKKIIQNTPFLYWSGNNNQIYKAFAELLDEGYVTKEVQHQEGLPSKHIYTITKDGLSELKSWLLSATGEPIFRKQILIKLALADRLKRTELENMLETYGDVVKMQAALTERELAQCYFAEREAANKAQFLALIQENIRAFYAGELEWVEKARELVAELPDEQPHITPPDEKPHAMESAGQKENMEVASTMNYRIIETQEKRYLHFTSAEPLFQREHDAVEIITPCIEHDTNAVLLEGESLADDFVKLRTGIAGTILQKFANYNIKAAVVIKDRHNFTERFQELVSEYHKGDKLRLFSDLQEATRWIRRNH